MASNSDGRRRTFTATTVAATLLASAAEVATQMTASADTTPPCTADDQHHCLALTNHTDQTLSVQIDTPNPRSSQSWLGCFTIEAKKRRDLPDFHLQNGAEYAIVLYPIPSGESTADSCRDAIPTWAYHTVDQPTKYEWIDIRSRKGEKGEEFEIAGCEPSSTSCS